MNELCEITNSKKLFMMNKKIIIAFLSVIILSIVVFVFFASKNKPVQNNDFLVNKQSSLQPTIDCISEGKYVDTIDKDSFQCCPGLVKKMSPQPHDENCNAIIPKDSFGVEPGMTCLACGDGVCNSKFEDKCSCKEDCK
jgi:hypothetical protein